MLKLFIIFLWLSIINCYPPKRVDNICLTKHFKRVYLHLGESGVLAGSNITLNSALYGNVSSYENCQMEIITCPSCIVSLIFDYINLSCCCSTKTKVYLHKSCRCDHVSVSEPPYDVASRVFFCGTSENSILKYYDKKIRYKSKTRIVKISLFYARPHYHAFTIKYKSEPNRQIFVGTLEQFSQNSLSKGVISSPYFPAVYPKEVSVEYVLTCILPNSSLDASVNCKVHLIFTDFLLASSSIIEFYDGNRRIDSISGFSFRPSVITTKTNSLIVRFSAKGQNNLGFKALFSFLSKNDVEKKIKVDTGCGGYVENSGGTITMMNMATGTSFKFYDCIWLIRPLENLKTHLYLKVIRFLNFAGNTQLQIRHGITSDSPLINAINNSIPQIFNEHVISLKTGYYLRLKAEFGSLSQLAIAYSSFGYNQCLNVSDFFCKNYRCISKKLKCDGYDHCGDNSEESLTCVKEYGLTATTNQWHSNIPNYYFPKMKSHISMHEGLLLLLLGLISLTFLASGLTILIYQIKKSRQERAFQIQMDSFSEIWDAFSNEVLVEEVVIDEPPSYEPPPTYDDVVKPQNMVNNAAEN